MVSLRCMLLLFASLAWVSACYPDADDDDTGPSGDDDDVADDDDDVADDDDADDDDDDDTEGDDDDDDTGGVEDVPAGAILFNEIMFNPSAANDTDGEWFELANTTGGDIALQGCTLADSADDSHTIGSLVVAAHGFVVLGISANDAVNGGVDVDYEYSNINLKNSDSDQLILTCVGEVDRVEWEFPGWPGDAGVSMSFDGSYSPDNDDPDHWCDASTRMPNDDWGTPGADNDSCGGGTGTIEEDDVVFAEVMQNPRDGASDPDGEWFELLNLTSDDLNLAGCTIRDEGTDSHTISGTLTIPAHGRVVLGYTDDTGANGGVSVDYEYGSSISLGNGDDELVLECNGEIDRIEYDNGVTWPNVNGASMNLDEAHALDNHLGNHWCESTTDMGAGDMGTPGLPNISC